MSYIAVIDYDAGNTMSVMNALKYLGYETVLSRNPEEIKKGYFSGPMAPEAVKCFNPAFDVTDHELITGVITERGICRAPCEEAFRALGFGEVGK